MIQCAIQFAVIRAVEEYQTALKYDPLHADTMCNLGSALQDLGDYVQSRYDIIPAVQRRYTSSKAVQDNPNPYPNPSPYHNESHFDELSWKIPAMVQKRARIKLVF